MVTLGFWVCCSTSCALQQLPWESYGSISSVQSLLERHNSMPLMFGNLYSRHFQSTDHSWIIWLSWIFWATGLYHSKLVKLGNPSTSVCSLSFWICSIVFPTQNYRNHPPKACSGGCLIIPLCQHFYHAYLALTDHSPWHREPIFPVGKMTSSLENILTRCIQARPEIYQIGKLSKFLEMEGREKPYSPV